MLPNHPFSSISIQNTTPAQPESARRYSPGHIERFLNDAAAIACVPNDEHFRREMIEAYGSMDKAVTTLESIVKSETYGGPPGLGESGVVLGDKPKRGDRYGLTKLANNVTFRVWDTGAQPFGLYAFDFVRTDDIWKYMLTPPDIRIEAIGPGNMSQGPVYSIETSMRAAYKGEECILETSQPIDENWESYLIQEGTHLRIWQGNRSYDVVIPLRVPASQPIVWNN